MKAALWLMLSSVPLAAQTQGAAPPLLLESALAQARERNPEIAAARKDREAAQDRVLPEKTWKAPQVGLEYWGFTGTNLGSAPEKWYDLSQDVPFPGKLRLKGEAASHETLWKNEVYRGVELDVLARVKEAYYRFLYVSKAKQILDENVEVMRRLAKTSEARYATGKASQSDVLRAQVELSKTLAAMLMLEQERAAAQARLNALLAQAPDSPLGLPQDPSLAPLSLTESDLEQAALAQSPEVRVASHHVDHMQSSLAAQRSEYLPDFMLQYTRRTREGMPSDSIAMIKVSLPFLYFWRQRAQTQAVSDELGQAQEMLLSKQDTARADVKADWAKVQTVGRLVELYRTSILPQAEQSLKVTEAAYQAERVDFLSLMDSERALLEFRLDYDQYVSQYGQSVAELERALGVDLTAVKEAAHAGMHHDHE